MHPVCTVRKSETCNSLEDRPIRVLASIRMNTHLALGQQLHSPNFSSSHVPDGIFRPLIVLSIPTSFVQRLSAIINTCTLHCTAALLLKQYNRINRIKIQFDQPDFLRGQKLASNVMIRARANDVIIPIAISHRSRKPNSLIVYLPNSPFSIIVYHDWPDPHALFDVQCKLGQTNTASDNQLAVGYCNMQHMHNTCTIHAQYMHNYL